MPSYDQRFFDDFEDKHKGAGYVSISDYIKRQQSQYNTDHLPNLAHLSQGGNGEGAIQTFSHVVFDNTLYILSDTEVSTAAIQRYYESIRAELPEAVQAKNSFVFALKFEKHRQYLYAPEAHTIKLAPVPNEQAAEGGAKIPVIPQESGTSEVPEFVAQVYYDAETDITADFSGKQPTFMKGDRGDEPLSSNEIFELIKKCKAVEDPRFTHYFKLRTTTSPQGAPIIFRILHPKGSKHTDYEYLIYTGIHGDFSDEQPVFSAGSHVLSSEDVFAHIRQKLKEGVPQYFNKVQLLENENREKITFKIKNASVERVVV